MRRTHGPLLKLLAYSSASPAASSAAGEQEDGGALADHAPLRGVDRTYGRVRGSEDLTAQVGKPQILLRDLANLTDELIGHQDPLRASSSPLRSQRLGRATSLASWGSPARAF
jgi:hypothetical protein